MKKLFFTLTAFLVFSFVEGQVYYGKQAEAFIPNAQTVRLNLLTQGIDFVQLAYGKGIVEDMLSAFLHENYKLSNDYSWVLLNSIIDEMGDVHKRYSLIFKGYIIHEGMFITHSRNQKIYAINGNISPKLKPDNNILLSENQALESALNYIGAKEYKWQLKSEEDFIKKESNNFEATWYPKGIIKIIKDLESGKYKYSWMFNIYAHEPMSRAEYYVDAQSGDIIRQNDLIQHSDSLGLAATKYSGIQPITTDLFNSTFRLRETGRGLGVETYDMNKGTNYGNAVDFIDSNNYWNNINAQKDEVAGDAHWGMEMTYDYYFHRHNRNSIDGNGFKLKGYVHYNVNYANAFWNGQYMTFGDGNSSWNPLVALDIVGHEITHGLTSNTANLDYSYESGAMNEAYSDIFGTAIEFYGKPLVANWLIGEDIGTSLRSMSNPKSKGDPDTYYGTNYYLGSADNGGVHTNSGVLNHWFYLTSIGGQGVNDNLDTFNVVGVGIDTAAKIAFRALTVYLINTSQYADARFYSIQAAMDLYGPCSGPVKATTSAFYAVGVGANYVPGVHADFSTVIKKYCSAPASVSFKNLSVNANAFYWDFGDGSTSNQSNPTHTYISNSAFDVKLISSGGTCGIDSVLKNEYISVDSANPCFTLLPSSGSITKTDCSGLLFDNGGLSNYSDNSNSTITLSPTGASSVTLTFVDFNFETGYDNLKIYDGPNNQSTLLGIYDGTTLPNGGIITSSGNSLTLVQTSDQAINLSGFIANWQCIMPLVPPVANFFVFDTLSCSGNVRFSDLSTNGPVSWSWHFGDGDSSNIQNPIHEYLINGYFNVSLTATNLVGGNTITKNAVVHIDKLTNPYAPSKAVCNGGSLSLTAIGTGGLMKWYDDATSTNVLDTGNVFVTPSLSQSKSYFVQEEVQNAMLNAGKATNGGGGGNLTSSQGLVFDVFAPITLHSVNVYANSMGTRTIILQNSAGATISTKTVNVTSGLNTVILDFALNVGTNYKLMGSNLYRNNSGVSYPYTLPGYLSITTSTAGTSANNYYYFYYDWKLIQEPCKSSRTVVHAYVNNSAPLTDFTITNNDPMVSFTDISQNPGNALWNFGDGTGSALNNPNHIYSQNGTYQVELNVDNGCGTNKKTKTVVIGLATGVDKNIEKSSISLYPNPAKNSVWINFENENFGGELQILDYTGKVIFVAEIPKNSNSQKINIENYSAGIYLIKYKTLNKVSNLKLMVY